MIIEGCKRTGVLAAMLVSGMMCGPHAAMADAIVTLSGPTSNAGMIDLSTTPRPAIADYTFALTNIRNGPSRPHCTQFPLVRHRSDLTVSGSSG